jgi:hypothetical protein
VAAKIDNVHSVNITSLNVLEQQEQTFTCEPEIEAEISLEIDVEIEGRYRYGGPDDYEPSQRYSISQSRTEYFYPEVVVRFDHQQETLSSNRYPWVHSPYRLVLMM